MSNEQHSNQAEWKRKAKYHAENAVSYAEESHQYVDEFASHYSALSEAHVALAQAYARKAGLNEEWGWTQLP